MNIDGEFWAIRRSEIHPDLWMYRRPGEEFWRYPPNFWRRAALPQRAVRPQSLARERSESAYAQKERLR